jgi:hypothetical protein
MDVGEVLKSPTLALPVSDLSMDRHGPLKILDGLVEPSKVVESLASAVQGVGLAPAIPDFSIDLQSPLVATRWLRRSG